MCSKTNVSMYARGTPQGMDMMLVKGGYSPFKGTVTYQNTLLSLITCTVFPMK